MEPVICLFIPFILLHYLCSSAPLLYQGQSLRMSLLHFYSQKMQWYSDPQLQNLSKRWNANSKLSLFFCRRWFVIQNNKLYYTKRSKSVSALFLVFVLFYSFFIFWILLNTLTFSNSVLCEKTKQMEILKGFLKEILKTLSLFKYISIDIRHPTICNVNRSVTSSCRSHGSAHAQKR